VELDVLLAGLVDVVELLVVDELDAGSVLELVDVVVDWDVEVELVVEVVDVLDEVDVEDVVAVGSETRRNTPAVRLPA